MELWVGYRAFLLHGGLRHLAETFGLRLTCLLRCWLEVAHGAHDGMRLWLLGTSYMVDWEDLMHWGPEVRDFDAGWGAYFQVHVWEWLEIVTWCGGSIWDTLEWWSYNDDDAVVATLGHGLSWDSTTFDTWEHMGDETSRYLFLWQTWGMAHCRYDGGHFMDLDVAHRESEIDEMVSSYWGGTHMDDDVGVDVADFM